jgi:hypothetical protein
MIYYFNPTTYCILTKQSNKQACGLKKKTNGQI